VPAAIRAGEPIELSVEVRNTGARSGEEVVQLYVEDVESSVPVPIRSLEGFRRVRLDPGESATVRFILEPRQMSLVADDGTRVLEPGTFRISVGGGQPGVPLSDLESGEWNGVTGTFEVTGDPARLDP
jgi:beta-glucosidase